MAMKVTSINQLQRPMNAVFLDERGNVVRKDVVLAGVVENTDGRTTIKSVPMVYDPSKKAYYPCEDYSEWTGNIEYADMPGDYAHLSAMRRQQINEMNQAAEQTLSAIEEDMRRREMEERMRTAPGQWQPETSMPPQPIRPQHIPPPPQKPPQQGQQQWSGQQPYNNPPPQRPDYDQPLPRLEEDKQENSGEKKSFWKKW